MKRLMVSVVVVAALAAAGSALAGGWATVRLESLPTGIRAGDTWRAEITVLRHARTPTDGASPSVTIRNTKTGRTVVFGARPTGETGTYAANVVFPESGTWRYEVDNGLEATGYGVSATTTYAPVRIAPAGPDGSFPVVPAGLGVLAALALAAGAVVGLRRRHVPATPV